MITCAMIMLVVGMTLIVAGCVGWVWVGIYVLLSDIRWTQEIEKRRRP